MKKYVKPEMFSESFILDKDIADLESSSQCDLDIGASDKETFENLFGDLG